MQTNNNEKSYYLHILDSDNYTVSEYSRAHQFNPLFTCYNYNYNYNYNNYNNYNYYNYNYNNLYNNKITKNYLDNNNIFMNHNIQSLDPFEYLCQNIENIQSLEKEYLLSYYKYQNTKYKIKKN